MYRQLAVCGWAMRESALHVLGLGVVSLCGAWLVARGMPRVKLGRALSSQTCVQYNQARIPWRKKKAEGGCESGER